MPGWAVWPECCDALSDAVTESTPEKSEKEDFADIALRNVTTGMSVVDYSIVNLRDQ